MTKLIARFRKNQSGATAIEYGLIAALIAAVLAGTLGLIGTNLNTKLGEVKDSIAGTAPAAPGGI